MDLEKEGGKWRSEGALLAYLLLCEAWLVDSQRVPIGVGGSEKRRGERKVGREKLLGLLETGTEGKGGHSECPAIEMGVSPGLDLEEWRER